MNWLTKAKNFGEKIKKVLKTDNYYETSKKVFLKHGSRKRNTPRVNKKSKQLSLF